MFVETAASGTIRSNHWVRNPVTSLFERTTLLEGAGTNLLLDSTPPTSTTNWSNASFTLAGAREFIKGEFPKKHTNDNSATFRQRSQDIGTLTASPETFSIIVENVDAAETSWGLYDVTAAGFVARGLFTWSTGAVSDADSTLGSSATYRADLLTDSGPFGGNVYRLVLSVTPDNSGNSRRCYIYPTGTSQNALTSIIHHTQHEESPAASSPIVTGAATDTRTADDLYVPFTAGIQEMTVYGRFFEGGSILGPSTTPRVWHIGSSADADPRCGVYASGGNYVHFHDPSSNVESTPAATPSVGDLVETRTVIHDTGAVLGGISVNEEAEVLGTKSAASAIVATPSAERIYLNGFSASTYGIAAFAHRGGVRAMPGVLALAQCRTLAGVT